VAVVSIIVSQYVQPTPGACSSAASCSASLVGAMTSSASRNARDVRLPDDPHAGAVARQDGRGVVGRSVVDDHHVDATERLGERAVEGLAEESGVVERGDDEAHRHRTTS